MKKLLSYLLVLVLTGCCFRSREEPETDMTTFHFKQKVRVTGGFFKGLEGVVTDEGSSFSDCYKTYGVYLEDHTEGRIPGGQVICNKYLEAL